MENQTFSLPVVEVSPTIVKRTLTVKETADYLGVHEDTIYTMVKQKQIPHFRVRRRIFFSIETINAWIRDQEEQIINQAM